MLMPFMIGELSAGHVHSGGRAWGEFESLEVFTQAQDLVCILMNECGESLRVGARAGLGGTQPSRPG